MRSSLPEAREQEKEEERPSYRYVVRQILRHIQVGQLRLEPLPVVRLFDANCCQVFGRHPSHGWQVVASLDEQASVFLHLEIC